MCDGDAAEPFRRFLAHVSTRWRVTAPEECGGRSAPQDAAARTDHTDIRDRCSPSATPPGIVKATTGGGIFYSL